MQPHLTTQTGPGQVQTGSRQTALYEESTARVSGWEGGGGRGQTDGTYVGIVRPACT